MHRSELIRRIHPNFRELTLFCCSHGLLTCQESVLVVIDETVNFRKPTPLHLNKTANFGADLTGKPDWEIFARFASLCTLLFRQPENTQLIHTESRSAFPSVLYILSRVCCYFGHPAVAEQQPRVMFHFIFCGTLHIHSANFGADWRGSAEDVCISALNVTRLVGFDPLLRCWCRYSMNSWETDSGHFGARRWWQLVVV